MRITEFCEVTRLDLRVLFVASTQKWFVCLKSNQGDAWVNKNRDGSTLVGIEGSNYDLHRAISDYCLQIRGHRIIVGSAVGRQEFEVPSSLEGLEQH